MRILEHRAGLDHHAAGLFDIGGVDALQPGDLLVLVGDERRPVECDVADCPAETGGILDLLMDVGAEHEQFFRHAAADHAGAAHAVLFGDHDLGAMVGRDPGGADAARTTSDDEEIDVEFSHGSPDVLPALLLPRPVLTGRGVGGLRSPFSNKNADAEHRLW